LKGPKVPQRLIDAKRNLARSHWLARRPEEAELGYKQVLALDPLDGAALEGLALIATFRGDEKEARRLFEKSLKADPTRGTVQINLISIYLQAEEFHKAKALAIKVLAKSPGNGLVHFMLGEAHRGLGEFKAAAAQYDHAADASGDTAGQVETAIQERLSACDWRAHDMEMEWVHHRLRNGHSLWQALLPFLISDSPSEVARATQIHAKWLYPPQTPMYSRSIPRHDRIRIGYVTAELFDHPVGNLIGGLLEHHDHDQFEIYAFSYGPITQDRVRHRLMATFDHFIEVGELDAVAICKVIAECEIDIAVTLSGYTRGSRPGILAYRPAPIQLNYCGFPGTMSAPFIDYMIADRHVIPEKDVETFSENIVWMPHHYQSADDKSVVSRRPITRAEEGLPEGRFVFMGYNTTNKITPQVFHTWMRILKRVENSVIWLSPGKGPTVDNLRREAAAAGVNPDRLIFAEGRVERAEHIARHALADLFLDTVPYNAHTTAADALWAGLPVMTCRGNTFPGRVCASILANAGLPELITDNLADYEELAVSLANDPERLKAIRERVAGEVRASPLFDTAGYTRDLETAYRTMYEIHRAGEAPRSFAVGESLPIARAKRAKPAAPAPERNETPAPAAIAESVVESPAEAAGAPRGPEALIEAGREHWKARHIESAEAAFNQVRESDPSNAAALEGLGLIARSRGNDLLARTLLGQALEKDPTLVEAAINLAPFLQQAGLPKAAEGMVERAIAAHPHHGPARLSLGALLWERGAYKEAFEAYETAIAVDPSQASALDTWLYERQGICDWAAYDLQVETLKRLVRAGHDAAQPYFMMLMSNDPQDLAVSAEVYAARRYPAMPALWTGERRRHDKIRLAYLTAEMSDHPVTNLLAGVWERHDKSAFEVTCISYGPPSADAVVRRVKPAFDHFIEASPQDALAIARTIHEREIDIALTLNGYTYNSQPRILAHRPAPVQVNYLGFPGTMGVPYIDYLIADRNVIAEDEAAAYSEKIVWMPDVYQPTDDAEFRPTDAGPAARAQAGLPRNAFIFVAFNHSYKITPAVFDVWMRILRRVPHGVLWLADKDETMRRNLEQEAIARGVKPTRLIFAPRVADRASHLARQRLGDLFLDTLPYGAHATASDALWAGLPVLTCRGTTFPARVCADLLTAAGLTELITGSLAEYEALAIALANNPKRLAAIRKKVAEEVPASRLFDTAAYTRHLESAYQTMHETAQAGLPPRTFQVD